MEDLQLTKKQVNQKVNISIVIMFFIIFVPSSFNNAINSLSLYLLIPLLFLYSAVINPKFLLHFKPVTYFILLLCWSVITISKSRNINLSLLEIKKLVGVFLLCYIMVRFCFINTKYIYIFYILYILKFFTIIYYGYTHGLVTDERFNLEELNANEFGYYGFFAVISAFFLWQSVQSNSLVKIFLAFTFVVSLSFSVISCFYAASRAGIVMSVLTASSLIIIYFFYPISKKYIWGLILVIIIVTIILPVLANYYTGSVLENRMKIVSLQDESRFGLAKEAVIIGFQNPVFGVGPGNFSLYRYGSFSHSTYTEIFANNGIIALILFLSILYYFFKKTTQLYLLGHNWRKKALYFYCCILLYSIYNLFYGFHISLFMMGFFYVLLVHLEKSFEEEEN